jgi:transcriptional regulator GlxA family with amidase domain
MTRTVAFLIFEDFQLLDAAGPIAAFEIAARIAPDAYKLKVIAREAGEVCSSSGVKMTAQAFGRADGLHTLVVSGGNGTRPAATDTRTLSFVQRCMREARRVTSVCSGSYILAAAGVLDGKPATTHWSRSEDFARRFPKVKLEPDCIYTRSGKVWTSAGITAGIDLSLALIAEDLGEEVARRTAQQLVVYRRRPGGQSQFSALLEMEKSDGRFSPLLDSVRTHLAKDWSVEAMADEAGMSPRNFARAFQAETGVTPAKAVERLRAEAARAALESGARSVQEAARVTGFGDPERMRRAFVRLFGAPPSAMKRAL